MRRMLNRKDVCRYLSISKSTLYRKVHSGDLPPATLYIGNSPRWDSLILDEWTLKGTEQ